MKNDKPSDFGVYVHRIIKQQKRIYPDITIKGAAAACGRTRDWLTKRLRGGSFEVKDLVTLSDYLHYPLLIHFVTPELLAQIHTLNPSLFEKINLMPSPDLTDQVAEIDKRVANVEKRLAQVENKTL